MRLKKGERHRHRSQHGNQRPRRTDTSALFAEKLPLKPTQCRWLLGLIATANGGSVVEARMSGNEEAPGKFSAQMMIVILIALVMWVLMDALLQKRQIDATTLEKTVERSTQTELNPVNQITIPTNVHCSPGGECHHTSRKCEGLKNVPMDAIRRRRSCMYCVQRNGQLSGEHREGCTVHDKVGCHLFFTSQCGAALWLPRRHRLIARKPLRVGKTVNSHCGRQ